MSSPTPPHPDAPVEWSRVGAVVLDLGNVILDLDNARYGHGWPDDIGASDEAFGAWVAGERLWYRYDTGRIATPAFVATLVERLGLSPKRVIDFYNSILLPGIDPRRYATLEVLRKRYPLYVLSNTSDLHIAWVKEHVRAAGYGDFEGYFDEIVYSFDDGVHAAKPAPEIYAALERKSSVAPGALLFVDDRPENVLAARERGWQAIELAPGRPVEEVLAPLLDQLSPAAAG